MKIWMLNADACTPSTGPLLRHYNFAKELIKRGIEATVFASNHVHFNDKIIDTEGKNYIQKIENSVPFVYVKTTTYQGNGIKRVWNMVSYYLGMRKITNSYIQQNGKPDVVIGSSVHPFACVAGIWIAKKYNIPCIIEIRDLWPEAIFMVGFVKERSWIGRILSAGERWIYEHGDAIIFTKEGDVDHIKEMKWDIAQGGKIDLTHCYYINNGVDLVSYYEQAQKNILPDEDLEDDTFKLIYTGTIRKVNNVDQILDAAKLLREYKDIKFLIYGTGNQIERIQQRVKEEELGNVILKGFVDKKYIPYILSKASANLLNYSQSQYNWARGNSSNKLFEYMASGKPVISTVKMGYSIIDKYHCGMSLESPSAQAMADTVLKIYRLSREDYEKIGANAKAGVRNFDFKILTDQLLDVVNSVIET